MTELTFVNFKINNTTLQETDKSMPAVAVFVLGNMFFNHCIYCAVALPKKANQAQIYSNRNILIMYMSVRSMKEQIRREHE